MNKLYVTEIADGEDVKKCGGCNWKTTSFYGIGQSKKRAREDFKGNNPEDYGLGLCANCMCEFISETGFKII